MNKKILIILALILLIPIVTSAPKKVTTHITVKLIGEEPATYQLTNAYVDNNCNGNNIPHIEFNIVNDTSKAINNPSCYNVEWVYAWIDEIPNVDAYQYYYNETCLDIQHSSVLITCDTIIEDY